MSIDDTKKNDSLSSENHKSMNQVPFLPDGLFDYVILISTYYLMVQDQVTLRLAAVSDCRPRVIPLTIIPKYPPLPYSRHCISNDGCTAGQMPCICRVII